MDQARNFAQANRSSIVNIVYIVAAVVLVYYLVMYYLNTGDNSDNVLLKSKMNTTDVAGKSYTIAEAGKGSYRFTNEYTVSTWIYINSYNPSGYQGILALLDNPIPSTNNALLTIGLDSTKPQMYVRAGKFAGESAPELTVFTPSGTTYTLNTTTTSIDTRKACDVMDIDLQRWINVTVSVNGRIMDVYLDGKLARSCINPNLQDVAHDKEQLVILCPTNPFNGYVSGLTVSNYALTPDVIYGRYQAGPYSGTGFLDYLIDKLGVRISYTTTETQ